MNYKEALKKAKPNFIDKAVEFISPRRAIQRRKDRITLALASGNSYNGASRSRKSMKNWNTSGGDADSDTLPDLQLLRERSRDLVRNQPLATGAINTKVSNIVGMGLTLQSQIDSEYLGLSDDEAAAWQRDAEREFKMWSESKDCSVNRKSNFYEMQELVLRSTLENGDIFSLLTYVDRPYAIYDTAVQLIEADRVKNKDWQSDTDKLIAGIQHDINNAATHIHVLDQHPGKLSYKSNKATWTVLPIYGEQTGRRNVLHFMTQLRVGQTRGIPILAPVIEQFKQLSDYTEAELTAAVVSAMFTVFVKTEGDFSLEEISAYKREFGTSSDELRMGSGSIIDLGPNEDISMANPGRPNPAFDPFVSAILRQIGVALEIPYELLVMQFNSSYSASKAALEQAWGFMRKSRKRLVDGFCQPVYEAWMHEAVSLGRLAAPGFMTDPAIRRAYLGTTWNGPSKTILDMTKEVKARMDMEDRGWLTAAENTSEMTGGDWETKNRQRSKEQRMRRDSQTEPTPAPAGVVDFGGQQDNADDSTQS